VCKSSQDLKELKPRKGISRVIFAQFLSLNSDIRSDESPIHCRQSDTFAVYDFALFAEVAEIYPADVREHRLSDEGCEYLLNALEIFLKHSLSPLPIRIILNEARYLVPLDVIVEHGGEHGGSILFPFFENRVFLLEDTMLYLELIYLFIDGDVFFSEWDDALVHILSQFFLISLR
jgi:hypothetical protein